MEFKKQCKGELVSPIDQSMANAAPHCWEDQNCFRRIKFVQADYMAEELNLVLSPITFLLAVHTVNDSKMINLHKSLHIQWNHGGLIAGNKTLQGRKGGISLPTM